MQQAARQKNTQIQGTMRNVIVSMNVTLDGFMAGPNCELDWHFNSWTDEMAKTTAEQLSRADTILFGRITYNAMARYWPARMSEIHCSRGDLEFAEMMNNYAKIVFSRTLTVPEWNNSTLISGDPGPAVMKLKKQPGKHMIIYGSGKIVSSLIRLSLVDELLLWVHPVAIGKGKPLFNQLPENIHLNLYNTKTFSSGVVLLQYTIH